MKIYKGILDALMIKSVYVISNENIYMCIPLDIHDTNWTVSCDSEYITGKIQLKVNFNGSFIFFNAIIEKKDQETVSAFLYEIQIEEAEKKADNQKAVFFMILSEIEEDYKEYNRRKEERFEIGLDEQRIKAINFKDAEHKLIINKKQLPCVINNISYSGAKITTEEENFEVNKRIGLCLSFINPIDQIFLIGTIQNCFLKTINGKNIVSVLSLELEQPPYEYNKRLQLFIKKISEDKK
ncbi:MAG: hypothetical protein BKP49_05205 [Treponema sp. CETP13]|nr:MAG: hypothetical protein BKP49_05205 [Treponema sp. CETP13]